MTTKHRLLIIALLLILLLMLIVGPVLSSDLAWCIDNYSPDRVLHCMHYENNIWGRYVRPAGW